MEQLIEGKRTDQISYDDTSLICEDYFKASSVNDNLKQAEYAHYIIEGVKSGLINPDYLLICSIQGINDRISSLIPMVIALKNKANPDVYIEVNGVGSCHMMVYAIITCKDLLGRSIRGNHTINIVLYVLKMFKSNDKLNAFEDKHGDEDVGEINNVLLNALEIQPSSIKKPVKQKTVGEYIVESRYNISPSKPETLQLLGIIMGIPKMITNPNTGFQSSMVSKSECIIDYYLDNISVTSKDLDLAIDNYCYYAYDKILRVGVVPDYFTINKLIILIKDAYEDKNHPKIKLFQEMLSISIQMGCIIDTEQLDIISKFSSDLASNIIQVYSRPRWSKLCIVDKGDTTPYLRKLALQLDLNPGMSKSTICEKIKFISSVNPYDFKAAVLKKNNYYLSSKFGAVTDYIGDIPSFTCHNRTKLQKDPMEFSRNFVIYYMDKDDKIYGFTSDMYEQLLLDGENPYNKNKIPKQFLQRIKLVMDNLKEMKINYDKPVSVCEAFDSLDVVDTINDDETNNVVATVLSILSSKGVSKQTIESKTSADFAKIVGNPIYEILTKKHAMITYCHYYYSLIQTDPTTADNTIYRLANTLM